MRLSRHLVIAFAAGLLSMLQVRVVGYVCLAEIAFALLAPWYLWTRHRTLMSGQLRPLLLLSLAWLGSALVTDLLRHSTLENTLKGAAGIVLWASCLICLYLMLSTRLAAIKWYSLGLACSSVISLRYFQPGALVGRAERLGIGVGDVTNFRTAYVGVFSLFVAALCLFAFRRFPRLVVLVMMLFSVVCFVGGSRGVAGVHAVAGVLTYYYYRLARRRRNQGLAAPIHWAWRVRSLLALATAGAAVVWGYGYAAPRGWIGEAARLRYEEKAASALGLLAARGEVFGGVLALIDSPIIGYGSWAADTNGYRARAWELIGFPNVRVSSEVMPGHSHVVSSWVAHGLWGGVFWVYVIYLLFRFILRHLPGRPEYLPYSTLTAIGLLWSIFASPFGARPATAAGLMFLVVAGEQAQRLLRQGARNGQAGSGATNGGGQHPAPPPGQPETVAAASK